MNDSLSLGTISYEGWLIKFNSPLGYEIALEEDGDGYQLYKSWIAGYQEESCVIGSSRGDLIDEYIPGHVLGLLGNPPDEGDEGTYAELYAYVKNSIDTISFRLPETMAYKVPEVDDKPVTSLEIQFIC